MNETTYTVRWTYVDQYDANRYASEPSFGSIAQAREFAANLFNGAPPEAWWIEAVTTVEYHVKD